MDKSKSLDKMKKIHRFMKALEPDEKEFVITIMIPAFCNFLTIIAEKDEKIFDHVFTDPIVRKGSYITKSFLENDYEEFCETMHSTTF